MGTITLLPGSRNLPGQQLPIADKPAHIGGEGNVFLATNGQFVVKLYHNNKAGPEKQKLLQQILDLGKNLGEDEQFLAWPLGIVDRHNSQAQVGVVTKRVPSSHVPLYKLIYAPRDAVEQFRLGRSWVEHLKIARGATAAVRTIHGKGMAHGDIHFKNLLADPVSGEVVLIDLDGLIVRGFLPPQVKGLRGFIAPEIEMGKATPSEQTDRHSLAVLVLWTLLLRNVMLPQKCYDDENQEHDDIIGYGQYACFSENPTDRRNWLANIGTPLFRRGALSYRCLTPRLQNLTETALGPGLFEPGKRPQAVEWERALAEAYDVLFSCVTCRQSFIYPFWLQPPPRRQCPFCGAGIRAPFPAILQLLEEKAKGQFTPVRHVALYHGLPLFGDVAESGRRAPFARRGTPIIGRTAWDPKENCHRLINESDTMWQVLGGSNLSVRKGSSVVLRPNVVISLGAGKRLLQVIE